MKKEKVVKKKKVLKKAQFGGQKIKKDMGSAYGDFGSIQATKLLNTKLPQTVTKRIIKKKPAPSVAAYIRRNPNK